MLLFTVNPKKLETGLRPNSAGIPNTLLLRIEAIGFPTFGLLLYGVLGSVDASCYLSLLLVFEPWLSEARFASSLC